MILGYWIKSCLMSIYRWNVKRWEKMFTWMFRYERSRFHMESNEPWNGRERCYTVEIHLGDGNNWWTIRCGRMPARRSPPSACASRRRRRRAPSSRRSSKSSGPTWRCCTWPPTPSTRSTPTAVRPPERSRKSVDKPRHLRPESFQLEFDESSRCCAGSFGWVWLWLGTWIAGLEPQSP